MRENAVCSESNIIFFLVNGKRESCGGQTSGSPMPFRIGNIWLQYIDSKENSEYDGRVA